MRHGADARARWLVARHRIPCERPYERAKRPATFSGACVEKVAKRSRSQLRAHASPTASLSSRTSLTSSIDSVGATNVAGPARPCVSVRLASAAAAAIALSSAARSLKSGRERRHRLHSRLPLSMLGGGVLPVARTAPWSARRDQTPSARAQRARLRRHRCAARAFAMSGGGGACRW